VKKLKIAIGADHGGFELKEKIALMLKSQGYEIEDFGTFNSDSCDYPPIAKKVAKEVASGNFARGILICGTGIGMSITANKIKGIRASLCHDKFSAQMSRAHNDANVLCMGQRVIKEDLALEILNIWLNTDFEGGRHKKRIDIIED